MGIKDWPEEQRPRERLIKNGAQALSNPELLAIFLRTGVEGKNAIDLGREMVVHFGSLNQLFSANYKRFSAINGLGPAKFAQLQAIFELARRAISEELAEGVNLHSPKAVKQYLQMMLASKHHETFTVIFLDVRNRLIETRELFRGTLTQTSVYPREVVKAALEYNAASIILAHNHPSGSLRPSRADEQLTLKIKEAASFLDITVLDHIIVSEEGYYSFADEGLI